eukprot:TRINITY_DN6055_c0_g1_i7.p1 TRINITY_DN6055_c0_g1~~TRINITY_DN6055_c0_g1_i7.p1  ORF type:complete len:230 (-),score=43.53 TRINITY_DN6055_c0_g1_i7:343-1032(-)
MYIGTHEISNEIVLYGISMADWSQVFNITLPVSGSTLQLQLDVPTSQLYAIVTDYSTESKNSTVSVVLIAPQTRAVQVVLHPTEVVGPICSQLIVPSLNQLWFSQLDATIRGIDLNTGAITVQFPTPRGDYCPAMLLGGAAVYAATSEPEITFWSVSDVGVATQIGTLSDNVSNGAMVYDAANKQIDFVVTVKGTTAIYSVNVDTGSVTQNAPLPLPKFANIIEVYLSV